MKPNTEPDWRLVDGWLDHAEKVPSPNFGPRPPMQAVESVVIHNISLPPGEYGSSAIVDFFQNRLDPDAHPYFREIAGLTVSAHFLIRRDGQILQFVSTDEMAWHAGVSAFADRSAFNRFSVGIELEGCDHEPFTEAQYVNLNSLILVLRRHYSGIRPELILGHSDIAPGRKTDPGPFFDWKRLQKATLEG
ncbi:1,6-anhydro-N-acetylmuramyl-L-alanine amidase AmpD [Allohahella sp. A8]|uniref:1,6-anhydro-N-acetylmuramyl-L-alanine amidase AmpD n=1 Tax=Allohahella sp. A8 TaxID=3141461 RepID=UPI003A80714F